MSMNYLVESLEQSLQRFEEIFQEKESIMRRDAAIKRFEFTVELAWKATQHHLRAEQIICQSPLQCWREAFKLGLITDDAAWFEMMEDRNKIVHTYDETFAQNLFERLPNHLTILKELYKKIKESKNS